MALQRLQASGTCCFPYPLKEFGFGERFVGFFGPICKEVGCFGGPIDSQVVLEGGCGVSVAILGCPEDVLAFYPSHLGPGEVQDSHF